MIDYEFTSSSRTVQPVFFHSGETSTTRSERSRSRRFTELMVAEWVYLYTRFAILQVFQGDRRQQARKSAFRATARATAWLLPMLPLPLMAGLFLTPVSHWPLTMGRIIGGFSLLLLLIYTLQFIWKLAKKPSSYAYAYRRSS